MADHSLHTLRVDHVGSLLRPKPLIDAFLARGRGAIGQEKLDEAADKAIRQVVARQQEIGLPVVTDGEFRRLNWQVSFSVVDGWDQWEGAWKGFLANPTNMYAGEQPLTRGQDAVETFKVPATSRLSLRENFPLREFAFLKSVAKIPAKAMLMGPDRVAQMCDIAKSAPHYTSSEAFLADVVEIQRHMVDELIAAGCGYVQLDEPSYTGYVDRMTLQRIKSRGEEPMTNLARAVRASNAVITGHQGKATFGIHICRGNRASMWHREGTYDGIAEELFTTLTFDRLLLEYDTERAGGFEPLRFVPKGKIVVLGLITTKTGTVETVDGLRRRIDEAARFIDIEQLAVSPQCGFASGIAGNVLTEDDQWRKLDVMLETARRVWG
jgi:5-methyltetrahydropteroyltriglutamate--homocysteine methyltransferase